MFDSLIPTLDQLVAFFAVTWSGFLVAALIIVGGQVSKAIASALGWRGEGRVYDLTLRAHPIVVGFLLGLVPFPTFESIDTLEPNGGRILVRCFYFAGWGCISGQLFELTKFAKRWLRRCLELKTGVVVTPSEPPPAMAPETPTSKRAVVEAMTDPGGES